MNSYNIVSNESPYFLENISSRDEAAKSNTLKRKKIYWIIQISAWLIFAVANIVLDTSIHGFSINSVFIWVIFSASAVLLTHVLRFYINKFQWLSLPLNKIIPRILLSSLSIGLILFVILLIFSFIFNGPLVHQFKFIYPIMGVVNLSSVILFWSLLYFSVHYFENYKKAEIESYIWEAAVKDFELKTLKSQLNPHFMFNALNSIRALIEEDPQSAQTAVTKLSNILRYSLTMERIETVPLEDEMKAVSDYLSLEKIRFEERLKYNINISEDSSKVEIPPMMIQTLVENGIKHGISKETGGGEIFICAFINGAELNIRIENTGQIDESLLKLSKGFGINNTKHRLNLLYGEKASFRIENDSKDKVVAEIIIPTNFNKII